MEQSFTAVSKILINAPQQAVWDTVTKPEMVKQYFFGSDLVTSWEVGSPIVFRGEWQGKPYEDKGTVLAFDPPHRLTYEVPDKYGVLTYEVAPREGQTELTISQAGIADEQQRDQMQQNWSMVLESIKQMLENE